MNIASNMLFIIISILFSLVLGYPTDNIGAVASPTPINCIIIGDFQTEIPGDEFSDKEKHSPFQETYLIASVTNQLYSDPDIHFSASLNYFGYSSMPNDALEPEDFTDMLTQEYFKAQLGVMRMGNAPFPIDLKGNQGTFSFMQQVNAIDTFNSQNRCFVLFSAVTDITGVEFTKYNIFDSIIAVGLNGNTAFPLEANYTTLIPQWQWKPEDATAIVNQIKQTFIVE